MKAFKTLTLWTVLLAISVPTVAAEFEPEKNWTYALDLPEKLRPEPKKSKRKPKAPILVWVPKDVKKIRAALLIPENSDSKHVGEHPRMHKVLAEHEAAVVYFRGHPLEHHRDDAPTVMKHIAKETGIEEFAHCPWITFGKSSRGKFPYYLAWAYPDRVIATISYHAETPTWPMADWSKIDKDDTILHCSVNGETEWGGTYAKHVRPSLLNYRANTNVLPHQAVAAGVGHGDYVDSHGSSGYGKEHPGKVRCHDVWDYLSVFADKALELRLPEKGYPTDGPLKLRKADKTKGLLLERFAIEDVLEQPRLPLVRKDESYVLDPSPETTTNGFAKIEPAKNYKVPDSVPVVDYEPGQSPTKWLVSRTLNFPLETDPQEDVSAYKDLRPEPDDEINVEGKTARITPLKDKEIGRRGGTEQGISIKHLGFRSRDLSLLAYTVLKVDKPTTAKIAAGHSLAVRVQLVLNGVPVDHKQVVQFQPGLYPLLMVARMKGARWNHLEPNMVNASAEEVTEAKQTQKVKDKREAELQARLKLDREPMSYFHEYSEVPAEKRPHMMWIADKELAEAWIKLHDPDPRRAELKAARSK
ncbi:MAG: hypothetical protein ACLFVU_11370 [Phycisphaerae bacterium]